MTHPLMNETFRKHSSPESIRAHLERAKEKMDSAKKEVAWLTNLFAARLEQIERGEWPATGGTHEDVS